MSDEITIDGGEWPSEEPNVVVEGGKRHIEDTRATLAYCLFGLLAAVMAALLALVGFSELTVDEFTKLAAVTISPIVGLVGAVSGYYYGRGDRSG